MRVVYTIFTLATNISVDTLTIHYELLSRSPGRFNDSYSSHQLEFIIYQLVSSTFADIYFYQLVAGGRSFVAESHQSSYSIGSPAIDLVSQLSRFLPSFGITLEKLRSDYTLEHLQTELTKA